LDSEELAVLEHLRSSKAKASYLQAHVLLRSALTAFEPGTSPGAWRITRTATGRSVVTGVSEPPCFSLSRTPALVGCSVAARLPHGLDIVDVDQSVDVVERIALGHEERAQLADLTPAARRERLASLWALKEAYVKARGLGLSLPVDQVSFRFGAEGIEAEFGVAIGDDPARWWFGLWKPMAGSVLALALEWVGESIPGFAWRQMSYKNLTRDSLSVSSLRPPLLASTRPRVAAGFR
jgi:4'-phosphopantetheinyl transferase